MQMEVFLIYFSFFLILFFISYITNYYPLGLIGGLFILVVGIFIFTDIISYKTGVTFSGSSNEVMVYDYTSIDPNLNGLIGFIFVGISFIVLWKSAKGIAKKL